MSDISTPVRKVQARIDAPVFYSATAIIAALVVVATLQPAETGRIFASLQDAIVKYGSWYYVLVVAIIVISVGVFSLTRLGDIKLGPDHSEPDYSFISWFAMLFSAGMGIGLSTGSVAKGTVGSETAMVGSAVNLANKLSKLAIKGRRAAQAAMTLSFFHWGIHAWCMYAIVALILAYFGYRHDLPLTLRSALYPLIGERIYGPIGAMVDVFAIIGTVFGVATSLGLGVLQINSGLSYLFGNHRLCNIVGGTWPRRRYQAVVRNQHRAGFPVDVRHIGPWADGAANAGLRPEYRQLHIDPGQPDIYPLRL